MIPAEPALGGCRIMDDSTAAMGHRLIFPVFFVTWPHYAPQKIKIIRSMSLSPRDEPHNPAAS